MPAVRTGDEAWQFARIVAVARVVILHGRVGADEYFSDRYPSASNSHWIPWLQKQLLIKGHDVQTPEVVRPYLADYDGWRTEFERHLDDEPMVLVGHSCGGGFFVRWLSEHPLVQVGKLVLVAPWLDPEHTISTDFFDFTFDPALPLRIGEFHLFHSSDDGESIRRSVGILLDVYPGIVQHAYDDMGHFCLSDMNTDQFPDLLRAITG